MKNAVVTGAGSGLGRELCLKLAERKYRILLADVNVAQARESLEMVRKAGGDGEIYACDVTQKEAVEQMARYAFNTFRRVDLLINNAGVTSAGFTGDIPIEDWEWCINIDMWGMIYGCHYFIPQMRTQGGGYIINVASAAGLVCLPEMGPYNVAKAGVIALSETIRTELAPHNIGVTVVCPSFFKTNLLKSMRYQNDFQKELAQTTFDRSRLNASDIAGYVMKAMDKNRLYVVPGLNAKLIWLDKRFAPEFFYRFIAFTIKNKLSEKLFMFLAQHGLT
ncbi:MAG: SDR family NAD(P)-dependent oxidoreductase [Deltaproteobacteria bacterium]|nr:SDR family NAD(P)-dependent oxidoreductase [Deltaproteobacteria bacterium]